MPIAEPMPIAPSLSDPELVEWMNTEGARRLERLRANPSSGLTLDQAFEGLIDEENA